MSNIITSNSGKKQATIVYSIKDICYRTTIEQIVNTGIGIELDFVTTKSGFSTYMAAVKWSLKQLNPNLK